MPDQTRIRNTSTGEVASFYNAPLGRGLVRRDNGEYLDIYSSESVLGDEHYTDENGDEWVRY